MVIKLEFGDQLFSKLPLKCKQTICLERRTEFPYVSLHCRLKDPNILVLINMMILYSTMCHYNGHKIRLRRVLCLLVDVLHCCPDNCHGLGQEFFREYKY